MPLTLDTEPSRDQGWTDPTTRAPSVSLSPERRHDMARRREVPPCDPEELAILKDTLFAANVALATSKGGPFPNQCSDSE